MTRFIPWIVLALAFPLACSDGEHAEPTASPCDPFATSAEPIELGMVLAAGRDSGGAIYVVDEDPSSGELRAYSGTETTLTRSRVSGTAQMSSTDLRRSILSIDTLPRPYTLIVEQSADGTRMARTFMTDRALEIDNVSESDVLELLEVDELADVELRNLPGEVQVEYFARLRSDELLLVTSVPDSTDYYGSFRLFYGAPAAGLEREILAMRRGRDGGSTTLEFELDGTRVTASFPVEFDGMQFMPGAWTLQLADETIPLEQLSIEADADLLEGAHFECLG